MALARPEFRPDPGLDRDAMEALQFDIAEAAVFADDLDADPGTGLQVAGVDQAFRDDQAVSAVVVLEDGEVVDRADASAGTTIPYIPGLLAFREAPSIIAAFEALETTPDVVLVDGSGRLHYRQAGLATHVGVALDLPTVGVIKTLLCGAPRAPLEDPLPAGDRVPIDPDDEVHGPTDGPIGCALQTRQYDHAADRHVNPVYVSSGHRVGLETAVDLVERWCRGYKLPEPVRLADRAAAEATA